MFRDRRKFPVFESEKLHGILRKLNLLEPFLSGEVKCHICEEEITEDNFGALYKSDGDIQIICMKLKCLSKIKEIKKDES